jgi:hypothetical protein
MSVDYKNYTLYELPPAGQGIAALQMLKMLEGFDFQSMEHNSAATCSASDLNAWAFSSSPSMRCRRASRMPEIRGSAWRHMAKNSTENVTTSQNSWGVKVLGSNWGIGSALGGLRPA